MSSFAINADTIIPPRWRRVLYRFRAAYRTPAAWIIDARRDDASRENIAAGPSLF